MLSCMVGPLARLLVQTRAYRAAEGGFSGSISPWYKAMGQLASYPGVRRGGEREHLVHTVAHALNLLTIYCVTEADDVYINIKNGP